MARAKEPKAPLPKLVHQTESTYGDSFKAHLFEQYQLYVASAERISERRVSANNYLLTVNAFLVTVYGLGAASRFRTYWTILVPITGTLVSITWYLIITSYRDLNTVKFNVIHELEQHMPAALYDYEWRKAEQGRGKAYRPLSHLERWIPIIFMILYLLLIGVSGFVKSDKLAMIGGATMEDDAIKQKLSEKFRAHELPRRMPSAVQGSTLERFEPMTINGGKGRGCCVCDEMIQRSDEGSMEFTYPEGRSYAFHQRCEELWQVERQKPILRWE